MLFGFLLVRKSCPVDNTITNQVVATPVIVILPMVRHTHGHEVHHVVVVARDVGPVEGSSARAAVDQATISLTTRFLHTLVQPGVSNPVLFLKNLVYGCHLLHLCIPERFLDCCRTSAGSRIAEALC